MADFSEGKYFIENVVTQRYLFQSGPKIEGARGSEGGWKSNSGFQAPNSVGADANYYDRAYWKFVPQDGDKYFIENIATQRYLFQDGDKIKSRGSEGGWLASSGFEAPDTVGADANYYDLAYWKLQKVDGDKYFIVNVKTDRYLFQTGKAIEGKRGSEGGWLASSGFEAPKCVGADANYYDRAYWKIIKQ